ncbi:hypothetical protein DICVIV_00587 [Dictyocaulus viviparus]|uniref:Amiloride-sensitive sodium channel n=1 Tax=Dictyocaulus viviparus TaxID=29172 RepID=A0A0D8YF61_DICVI|nr:hypothetical protein DICVIV_00587 [Dictyocaulus viviparus]
MNCRMICNITVLLLLVIICIVLFIIQSLYFIIKIPESSQKERIKTVDALPLFIPAIIICNRMPFSQDGVNSVSEILRQDSAMRYLLEWTNPSLRESADYVGLSQNYMNQGQTTLFQYLPQNIRNQSINQMTYMCQSVINSCSYQGVFIQAYECCKNIVYKVPTMNGLCWVFKDRLTTFNSSSSLKQFSLTFQMSRNSWYSQQTTPNHPGIDIYLSDTVNDNVIDFVNQLQNPIRLFDKKGVRLRMHKEKKIDLRRTTCGQSPHDAELADENAIAKNRTNLLMCIIMVSIQYCGCHPLFAEMIPYDTFKFRDFSLQINSTQVCTVDQYEECTRRYIDLIRPSNWKDPIPNDILGYGNISHCRSNYHYPCETISYPGIVDQYDLPSDYLNTQDFVARFVLEYGTTRVKEIITIDDSNVYEILTFIGYNIATWFSIGHIIWSLYTLIWDTICCTNKIAPESNQQSFLNSNSIQIKPAGACKENQNDTL